MALKEFKLTDLPTPERLIAHIEELGAKCWVCTSEDWILKLHEGKPAVTMHRLVASPSVHHLPAFSLICEKCDNIWLLSMQAVMQRIAPPEEG